MLLQPHRTATVGARASQSSQSSPSGPQINVVQSILEVVVVVQFGMMGMSCLCVCVFLCASLRERVILVPRAHATCFSDCFAPLPPRLDAVSGSNSEMAAAPEIQGHLHILESHRNIT